MDDPKFIATRLEIERNLHNDEEALIVTYFLPKIDKTPAVGWLACFMGEGEPPAWGLAPFGSWEAGEGILGFCHAEQNYEDRISGGYDGGCWGAGPKTDD